VLSFVSVDVVNSTVEAVLPGDIDVDIDEVNVLPVETLGVDA
jgi:hypothetical protein